MLNSNFSPKAAEARLNEIEQRIDAKISIQTKKSQGSASSNSAAPVQENFQATMAAMIQSRMYSEGMGAFIGDNSDNKNSLFGGSIGSSNMLNMGMIQMLQENMAKRSQMEQQPVDFNNGLFGALPLKKSQGSEFKYIQSAQIPVQGRISSGFGHRHDPIAGHHGKHAGVDIAASHGAPIKAPWGGVVTHVGNIPGFGNKAMVIAHPETRQPDGRILYSVLGHNSDAKVSIGEQVLKGQVVGAVGSEGRSTGPHLHWETRWAQPNTSVRNLFKTNIAMATNPLNFA